MYIFQVLPFLLRRVKEDVLRELPPKITQDYYCELSPLQRRLYEHFSREHMPQDISAHTHVFQVLIIFIKLFKFSKRKIIEVVVAQWHKIVTATIVGSILTQGN